MLSMRPMSIRSKGAEIFRSIVAENVVQDP